MEGRICVTLLHHSILWQLRDEKETDAVYKELLSITEQRAQFFIPNLKAYEARLALFDGDAAIAREWLTNYSVVDMEHVELFRAFQHFTTARAYLALGEMDSARHYLLLLRDYGRNLNRPLDEAEAEVLLSILAWSKGEKKDAVDILLKVLETMQPYSFVRIIADEGAAVLPILKRCSAIVQKAEYGGILSKSYLNEVILAAHAMSKHHKGITSALGQKDKPVKLSRQQTRMIELLAQGYKNVEIAGMTGLSIPTIKTHTSIAYRKLGVNNALDAVLKAKELGIIE